MSRRGGLPRWIRWWPCDTNDGSGSKPIRKGQLYQAGNPVGIKSLIADFVLPVLFHGMAAPVRPRAVQVGKSVFAGQRPRTEDASALLVHLRIRCERHHCPADVSWRFRHHEILGGIILVG